MGESIIIESPELQTRRQRRLFAALTCILWAVWTYLWLPVISALEWLLGLPTNVQSFVLDGYAALLEVLVVYCSIIGGMGGSLVAWATYNHIRFRGLSRRNARAAIDLETLADYHAVEAATLAHWQEARLLILDHDEGGSVSSVTLLRSPPHAARQPAAGDGPPAASVTYVIRGRRPTHPPFGDYLSKASTS